MTRILHAASGLYRGLALLAALAFGISWADAALESDDISAAILKEGSVAIKWENDKNRPWYLDQDENGQYIRTPEKRGDMKFSSTLKFTYTSQYPVEITFSGYRSVQYDEDNLSVRVDGEVKTSVRRNGWQYDVYEKPCFIVPAGSHTVEFLSTSNVDWDWDYNGYFAGIRDLRVWECKELESSCLKEGSIPLTFENDSANMWITEDGYIRSTDQTKEGVTSKISTTFTIDKPSLFSFEHSEGESWNESHLNVMIDGVPYKSYTQYSNINAWSYSSVVLYPGTHTVEFEHVKDYANYYYWVRLRNVQLDQSWLNVTLNNPGELGVRLLQALGDKNLQDAELVKINGSMNSDDWAIIRQLTGVKAIDFTGANITAIPSEACRDLNHLSTVMLPETVKEIGPLAFYRTDFHRVTIPASVETINWRAWLETPLQYIDFAENSQLKKIGCNAFAWTNLIEFDMPDSVVEAGRSNECYDYTSWSEGYYDEWDVFVECPYLKKVHLSDGLSTVPRGVVYHCPVLEEINIPKNATVIESYAFTRTAIKSIDIPESVTYIAYGAFYESGLESVKIPKNVSTYGGRVFSDCKNLKEVHFSSHVWGMSYTLSGCVALEKVVLPCATPPTRYSSDDPFADVNKSQINLVVPDFALEAYKADPYWYQFTNTTVSDEASVNDYWAIRGSLTLDANHAMQGTPALEMMEGGALILDSDSQQNFGALTFNTSESAPAAFLSRSNAIKANSLESNFYVRERDRWYFFSPVSDVKMADVKYPATDSWVIRYYDGARRASEDTKTGNWQNVPADGTLRRGEGYIIQAREPGWLHMPAASADDVKAFVGSNEETLALADNACDTGANAGWNFVANPYPAFYDIYYIDMQAPITVWDGSTYRAFSLNDGDRGDDTFVLRPMQPFFVQKTAADLAVKMPLVGRQSTTAIDRTRAPQKPVVDPARQKLNLEILRAGAETADDYTRIVINESAPMAYDASRDASKFMSMNAEVAQLYSLGEKSEAMAINERPYDNGIVALGVYIPAAGETYTIAASRTDRQAWLFDAETGIEQDLTAADYTFMPSKTGVDNGRFSIRFAPAESGVASEAVASVKVRGSKGFISIMAPSGSNVAVYSADGRVVAELTASSAEIPAAAGAYIVTVNGRSFKTIVK